MLCTTPAAATSTPLDTTPAPDRVGADAGAAARADAAGGAAVALHAGPVEETLARLRHALADEGLTVLFQVQLTPCLQAGGLVVRGRWVVLAACCPWLATRTVGADATALPQAIRRIVVCELADGQIQIATDDPITTAIHRDPELRDVAAGHRARLVRTLGMLAKDRPG